MTEHSQEYVTNVRIYYTSRIQREIHNTGHKRRSLKESPDNQSNKRASITHAVIVLCTLCDDSTRYCGVREVRENIKKAANYLIT